MASALRCLTLVLALVIWTLTKPVEFCRSFVGIRSGPAARPSRRTSLRIGQFQSRLARHASGGPYPSGTKVLGDRIWMDITLTKPLGIKLESGKKGDGSGVGVGDVVEGGSAAARLEEAIAEGAPPLSWVQEGDELLAVDGNLCRGSLERAVELITEGGSEVTLKLQRPRRGNVQVVFPGGLRVTAPGKAPFPRLAESVGYDWGSNVWHEDAATGEMYDISSPDYVPAFTPSKWLQHGEDGVKNEIEGIEFENWRPLVLKASTQP